MAKRSGGRSGDAKTSYANHSQAAYLQPSNERSIPASQEVPPSPPVGEMRLSRQFGIDEANLAWRRRFLHLEEADRQLMAELVPWARSVARAVGKEFYDWQFSFEPTRQYLEGRAREKGLPLETLRQHLEMTQARYFVEIFEGSASGWDLAYFERRLRVGEIHEKIDLPLKWYIGSYVEYQIIAEKYLSQVCKDAGKRQRVQHALLKVFNLDMQAVMDAFLLSNLAAMGLNLDGVRSAGDRTEQLQEMKDSIALLVKQAEAMAGDRLNDTILQVDSSASGRLGEAFMKMLTTLNEFAQQADALAKGDLEHQCFRGLSETNVDSRVVASSMKRLVGAQKHIATVAQSIAEGDLGVTVTQRSESDTLLRSMDEMIRSIRSLIVEMNHMSDEHNKGETDAVMPVERFNGAYKEMAIGVNEMVAGHIEVQRKAIACVAEFGRGNFEAPLERFPGKKAFINETIETVRGNLKYLVAEATMLVEAAKLGKLATRADANKHQGDYRKIVEGVNQTLDSVIGPLNVAADYVTKIGRGAIPPKITDHYNGDFNAIKDNLNNCIDNINALIADADMLARAAQEGRLGTRADTAKHHGDFRKIVEGVNQTLEAVIEPLKATANSAHTLASSAEELTAVSQQMAGGAEETATQANVVSAASDEVSRNVTTVATGTEQMQASIREISKNANEAARVAKTAVSVAHSTNDTITKLGESSQEIGNVIKVITSIAQQTNLLALNATIEAARAGEAGKGFAVVANEVKELAKQTAKATEEIGRKIEAIQGDTKGAVRAIAEIGSIINQINDISNSIASAVEEQTVTTNEIGRNVAEAAKGTGDIAKNIAGVAIAAKNTTQGANDTQRAAQELSRMAAELQTVVARYQF